MDYTVSKITWHFKTLTAATKKALDLLSAEQWLKRSQWYLAGGTALALQAGHRRSVDLDFFMQQANFNTAKLLEHFKKFQWQSTLIKEGTVYGILQGAKVSFITYPFFVPAAPKHRYGAVRVLDARDIAVMKIIAISQRGRKRDFYDLYWYTHTKEPLLNVLRRVHNQYPQINHNYHHLLKSLVYFNDAEHDPTPKIFFQTSWKTIKKYFISEVRQLTKSLLKL